MVGDLINPVQGIRDEQRRKGIQPKDHMAENRRIIRNISHQKQREALKKEEEANAEKFKLAEYQNVGSRVMQKVNEAKAEEPKDFLKAHSGAAGAPHMYPREATTAGSYVPRQAPCQAFQNRRILRGSMRNANKPESPRRSISSSQT